MTSKKGWIGLIDLLDTGNESESIRQTLEYYGYQTITYRIGRPLAFMDLLHTSNHPIKFEYLIICAHGENGSFVLPKLAPEVYLEQEIRGYFGPGEILKVAHLAGEKVVTTACGLGTLKMGESFVSQGATCFIGPGEVIEGNASLFWIHSFFYEVSKGKNLAHAFHQACSIDEETALFVKFDAEWSKR